MLGDHVEIVKAVDMMQQIVDDICSSVPFQLGFHPTMEEQPAYPHFAGCAKSLDAFGLLRTLGSLLLIRPLKVATKVDCVPETQRQWIRQYLTVLNKDPRNLDKEPLKVCLP